MRDDLVERARASLAVDVVAAERLRSFVAAVRRDCAEERLPFYVVQLGRMLEWIYYPDPARRPPALDAQWSAVREAERRLVGELPGVGMVPAADLELEDSIHLDTANLKRVGRRLARLARREVYGERELEPAIGVAAIEHDPEAEQIRVRFTGVHGRLPAAGRIVGFSLRRPDGTEVAAIFAAGVDRVDPSAVVLRVLVRTARQSSPRSIPWARPGQYRLIRNIFFSSGSGFMFFAPP